MILHNDSAFKIYFGNAQDCCVKSNYEEINTQGFKKIKNDLNLEKLVFLKQIHGIDGSIFTVKSQLKSDLTLFEQNGDFLITNLKNVGIGVLTADCLPVVFYDQVQHIAAIAHAGWKGLAVKIINKTICTLQDHFNTKISDLMIYFGPCAKVCCYQIQENFLENPEILKFAKDVILKSDVSLFFDIVKFAQLQLLENGIKSKQISTLYNCCTICNVNFHSYRRDKANAGRQATIICLK